MTKKRFRFILTWLDPFVLLNVRQSSGEERGWEWKGPIISSVFAGVFCRRGVTSIGDRKEESRPTGMKYDSAAFPRGGGDPHD
jgi:hypothetical protein